MPPKQTAKAWSGSPTTATTSITGVDSSGGEWNSSSPPVQPLSGSTPPTAAKPKSALPATAAW